MYTGRFFHGQIWYGKDPPEPTGDERRYCRWIYMGNNNWQWVCRNDIGGGNSPIGGGGGCNGNCGCKNGKNPITPIQERRKRAGQACGPGCTRNSHGGCDCDPGSYGAQMACPSGECSLRGGVCYCNGNELRANGTHNLFEPDYILATSGDLGPANGKISQYENDGAGRACRSPFCPDGTGVCIRCDEMW